MMHNNANNDELIKHNDILQRFNLKAADIKLDERARNKLANVLAELKVVLDVFPEEELSNYALNNWADVFLNEENATLSLLLSQTTLLNNAAKTADTTMTWVYLGLNFVGLLLSVAAMHNFSMGFLADDTVSTASGSGWNYIDTLGGVVAGIRQIQQGELGMGIANLMSSCQLAACTIIANIAKYTSLIHLSAAAMSGLMGFSFAACMFISCGLELYEAQKCSDRIAKLEATESSPAIQKAILIEKAQRENHIRSAKSWAGCAVGMTAVAIISYIALSSITFGALPAATVAIAAIAFVSGVVRKWWVSSQDHVENVKQSLKENEGGSLLDRLNKIIETKPFGLDFTKSVAIHGSMQLKPKYASLKSYLEQMAIHNPKKLENILLMLETKPDKDNFINALKTHRNSFIGGGVGSTMGYKIFQSLEKDLAKNDPSYVEPKKKAA